MQPNEVLVGFPKQRPKLDADGDPMHEVVTIGEDGIRLKVPIVRKMVESHGYRVMHVDMLGRIARRLTQLNMPDALPGIVGWIDEPSIKPPDQKVAASVAKKLHKAENDARARARLATTAQDRRRELKDAVYFEAAAFCHEAWLAGGDGVRALSEPLKI